MLEHFNEKFLCLKTIGNVENLSSLRWYNFFSFLYYGGHSTNILNFWYLSF